jgi:hypothetical protein
LLITLLLLATPLAATDYYVDCDDGSDASAGDSPATAWATLAAVRSAPLVLGDVVHLKRGCTWRETLTLPADNITVRPYGDPTASAPRITGTDLVEVPTRNLAVDLTFRGGVVLEGLQVDGAVKECVHWNNGTANNGPGGVGGHVVRDLEVSNCGGHGVAAYNSSNNLIHNVTVSDVLGDCIRVQTLHLYNDSDGNTVSNSFVSGCAGSGIELDGWNGNHMTGWTIRDNRATDSGDGMYVVYADDGLATGNRSWNNFREGSGGEGYGIGVCDSSYNVFEHNVLTGNRTRGMEISTCGMTPPDGNVVRYNVLSHNGDFGFMHSGGPASVDLGNAHVHHNLIYGNGEGGLFVRDCGHVIESNLVSGHPGFGMRLYADDCVELSILVRGNVFEGPGNLLETVPDSGLQRGYNLFVSPRQ